MSAGRPTKYKREYGEIAIDKLSEGYSMAGLAGHLKVCRFTIYHWAKEYPEFAECLEIGKARASLWWETRLIDIANGKDGNATVAIFGVKNRASDEWRDRIDHDVKGGITVTISPEHDEI